MNKSSIDGATLFVKKITSLNPTQFKFISLQDALDKYSRYLFTIHDTPYRKVDGKIIYPNTRAETAKSFKEWLRSEI